MYTSGAVQVSMQKQSFKNAAHVKTMYLILETDAVH